MTSARPFGCCALSLRLVARQAKIGELEDKKKRLRDICVLGDHTRAGYTMARANLLSQIADPERQLGRAEHPIETLIASIGRLGELLSTGISDQQKRALAMLFEHLNVDLTGNLKEAKPQSWARPLFAGRVTPGSDTCPRGPRILVAI